jgi:ABC-type glycerol-3-phosphate transport system substrate-binding protein
MNKKTLAVSTFLTALLLACGPTSNGDQITLTYAAWNLQTAELNNIERQMIAVYEEENPNINIEVIERPVVVNEEGQEQDVGWEEFFATQAAVDNLPDVYMVYSIANFTTQGWAEDVTDLVQADAIGASLHKWTCAPIGVGMLVVKTEWIALFYLLILKIIN